MKRRKPQLIDRERTAAANFLDGRSYIKRTRDGEYHTFLFGVDMTALRRRVLERSRGFCEMKIHGVLGARCQRNISWETMELHHEPPLSQGGFDSEESTIASCRRCQTIRHNRITKFTKREPQFSGSRKVEANG